MGASDTEFIETLTEIFGEQRTEEAILEGEAIKVLQLLWNRAIEQERRHVFDFLRRQMQFSDDKEGLVQMSWVIGNGSYRTTANLSERPWWLTEDRDWKAYVSDRLEVKRTAPRQWAISCRENDEMLATITQEDGKYEVWHTPEDPAMIASLRVFTNWPDAMSDVVAVQVMKEAKVRDLRASEAQDDEESG
jgi:hypothetical protein